MTTLPNLPAQNAALAHKIDSVWRLLVDVSTKVDHMTIDTTKLVAAVSQLQADSAKNSADIQAIAAALGGATSNDPAVQAVIDKAVADLGAVDANIQASNKTAETAVAPAPTPAPAPPAS